MDQVWLRWARCAYVGQVCFDGPWYPLMGLGCLSGPKVVPNGPRVLKWD